MLRFRNERVHLQFLALLILRDCGIVLTLLIPYMSSLEPNKKAMQFHFSLEEALDTSSWFES